MKNLLIVIFIIISVYKSYSCTSFLITGGASVNGHNMISYNADSHVLYGELYHWAAAKYPVGAMLDIYDWDSGKYMGKIPQARETYTVNGNMNEFQVAIGETTFGGKPELEEQDGAIMDYGSLIYIALQRSKSAREAIKVISELMDTYGYASAGESFSIMDKNEVWIMEMIGKGNFAKGAVWVAMKVPDGMITAHANQSRIQTFPLNFKKGAISNKQFDKLDEPSINTIYAFDVISFAKERGYFNGNETDFSFSDAYNPIDFGSARFCESRVWSMFRQVNNDMQKYELYAMGYDLKNRMPLFIKPDKKISLKDMFGYMGDHFEGTKMDFRYDCGAGPYDLPYRWRPMTWTIDSIQYFNERSTSTQQTGFTFVAEGRHEYADPLGGILWFGPDDSYFTVHVPIFCGITASPENYKHGVGSMIEFNPDAAFWVFNQVANFAYTRYNTISPIVKEHQAKLEDMFIDEIDSVSDIANKIYIKNKKKGIAIINEYSLAQARYTIKYWKDLYGFLFIKFVDGNVKWSEGMKLLDNGNGRNIPKYPKQPGYGYKKMREIIKETGDRYRMPGK